MKKQMTSKEGAAIHWSIFFFDKNTLLIDQGGHYCYIRFDHSGQ